MDSNPPMVSLAPNVSACSVSASPSVTPTPTSVARQTPSHPGELAPAIRVDQEGDEYAHDGGSLEAVPQPDECGAEYDPSAIS
jgi:hypothetical protein